MIATVIVTAILALLAGFLGALVALKIQYRYLQRTQAQRTAWEQAQESGQRTWEIKQEKRALEMEAKLVTSVQQVEGDWNTWKQKNVELVQAVSQQHAEIASFLHIERELARIPLVEEMPIAFDSKGQRLPLSSRWQPLALARVDLSERDLSRRYLGQANLREARLRGANLFMADLSGADLSGADLTGADLTGANLSHADLHDAILLNADLQVADMHNTILFGANLHGARHLSAQQLDTAIYDATCQLDAEVDLTIPRLPRVNKTVFPSTTGAQTPSTPSTISDIPATPVIRATRRANEAANMELETPDLDVSPTPVAKTRAAPSSPAPFATDGVIEGEITEISDAATIETAAASADSVSEATDAEIREISETGETEAVATPTTSKAGSEETFATSETGTVDTLDANDQTGSASDDVADATGETGLGKHVDSLTEIEMPDIAPLPMPTSFEATVDEQEHSISASEPSTFESETLLPESEASLPESEASLPESEPSETESPASESEFQLEMPSWAADRLAPKAPVEALSEPEFVALEIEHGTNGNGHVHNSRNGNGNGNGHKRGTSAGSGTQKGKNGSRRRSKAQ